MAVLRLKYKRAGKTKTVRRWYVDFTDHKGISRRMPGYLDKSATTALEGKIKDLVGAIKEDLPVKVSKLGRWFAENADAKIRNSLSRFGLLEAAAGPKTLDVLVSEFVLTVPKGKIKNGQPTARNAIEYRIRKVIADNNFSSFEDCNNDRLDNYFREELDGSPQTRKCYLIAFKRFAKWLFKNGHTQKVLELRAVKVPHKAGRCFEKDEYEKLLTTVRSLPKQNSLTGTQRYLLYLMAVQTGFRANEISKITVSSFDFDNNKVLVPAGETKNDDEAWQDITVTLNSVLKEYTRNMLPGAKLFDFNIDSAAKMVQQDCRDAGIGIERFGKKINFHSLRHCTATFLLAAGENIKVVQQVMRHADIQTTLQTYGHLLKGQQEAAVARFESFCNVVAATGTD